MAGVKVVDGLDKPDAPHLKQIIQVLAPACKFLHHTKNQTQVTLDHLLPGALVAIMGRFDQTAFFRFAQNRKL